jgi:hypothetical protein
VNPALKKFLQTRELDQLAAARQQITVMDSADRAALEALLASGSRPQAVANLLMVPDVMPPGQRLGQLLKALDGSGYWVLAALVGLQELDDEDLPHAERPALAARLLALIQNGTGLTAQRASVTLGRVAEYLSPSALAAALAHPDGIVRHNLLVALLSIAEPEEIRALAGGLDPAARDFALTRLRELGFTGPPDPPTAEVLTGNMLALPQLAYIPNFDAWQEQRRQAAGSA